MPFVTALLAGFFGLAALLHIASLLLVGLRGRRRRAVPPPAADAPGVSIVRPVCGIENHIEATLGSAFRLNYPRYEILFCVASSGDPIIPVVESLIAEHPQVAARLLVGDDRVSINPKLNNVVKGWEAAAFDWIVMADSNVLMPPDYLDQLFARWSPSTGLVCSPPVGAAPDALFSELECGFLNTFQARWQLAADAVGIGFAQGKTMLWRRDILEDAGGIRALAAEAAEDAAGTKIVRARGLVVRLVPRPFPQPLGRRRLAEVWKRQLRWARLRRVSFKLFFLPEILAGGFFPILALAGLVAAGAVPSVVLPLALAGWYGAEAWLARAMGWPLSLRAPLLWILRDLMLPPIWVAALCGHGFNWRGNEMSVRAAPRRAGDLQLAEE